VLRAGLEERRGHRFVLTGKRNSIDFQKSQNWLFTGESYRESW
jgi:hypothetical protein